MSKLIIILKYFVFASLLLLFFSASFTTKNHCETCEFELEGDKISASQFVNDYFEECINPFVKKNNYENFSGMVIK